MKKNKYVRVKDRKAVAFNVLDSTGTTTNLVKKPLAHKKNILKKKKFSCIDTNSLIKASTTKKQSKPKQPKKKNELDSFTEKAINNDNNVRNSKLKIKTSKKIWKKEISETGTQKSSKTSASKTPFDHLKLIR